MACDPNKPFSTYGNPKVTTYQELGKRIAYALGYPVVQLEIHSDAVYENIAQAVEFFTKFAGREEVHLIFNSNLHEPKRGIYLPRLFSNSVGTNTVTNIIDVPGVSNLSYQVKAGQTRAIDTFSIVQSASAPVEYTVKYYDPYNGRAQTAKFVVASRYNTGGNTVGFAEYGNTNTFSADQVGYNFVVSGNDIKLLATPNYTGFCEVLKTNIENNVIDSQIYNEVQTFTQLTSGGTYLVDFYTNDNNRHPVEFLIRFTDTATGHVQASNYLVSYKTYSNTYSVSSIEISYATTSERLVTLSAVSTSTGINLYVIPSSAVATESGRAEIGKNNVFPKGNTSSNRLSATFVTGGVSALDTFDVLNKNSTPYEYTLEFVTATGERVVKKWTIAAVATDNVTSVSGVQVGYVSTDGNDFGEVYLTTSGTTGTLNLSATKSGNAYIYKNVNAPQRTISEDLGIDGTTGEQRKILEVTSFEEGTSQSINSLFTIESTLAQQTYFSFALGNYGFDMISWHLTKSYLETRAKLFASKQYFQFDARTQYLRIIPEPNNTHYYALITCYLEKPFSEILKEPWVFQYALALTKIALGRIRGKYGGIQLFGGATLVGSDLIQEGLAEKERLEEKMLNGASAGFGDSDPISFYLG